MALDLLAGPRRSIADAFHAVVGTHDEPEVYGGDPGDPGLVGPGSVSWELHSNLGVVSAAGSAAIIMEILHPSVMAGVHDHSSYREDPLRRARSTLGYVLVTTFGSTAAAERTIAGVKRAHSFVTGTRPDGVAYEALDPTLVGWVHTCIPWAILEAYDRYARPLTVEEKDRYLAEQAVIGRLGGAGDDIPETYAALGEYVDAMRPRLVVNEQTRGFLDFLIGDTGEPGAASTREQLDRLASLQASMRLMPGWARRLAGLHHPEALGRFLLEPNARLQVALLNWAVGTPECRRLAEARAGGERRATVAACPT